ncbi:hypothetical protein KIW84_045147 [Lathyrus oleraceus]|uniref:Uncharacterized protein n=1 Tax=Pisum sativum TaxID=3888 RepID=A0A9D4XN34_PEA|nr:hypothetical protein KIW84_045147 [Pisum sativum]
MAQKLMAAGMTKEVDFIIGKNFNGHTLKNIFLITNIVDPSELLDKSTVGSRRILVDDYPLFSKEESNEVLEHYNKDCIAKGCPQNVLSYVELPNHPIDMYPLIRSSEVTPSENHGKSPMTETPFFSARSIISTSSIPP